MEIEEEKYAPEYKNPADEEYTGILARCFVFTINNYTEETLKQLKSITEKIKYISYGQEVGEQGTPHIQGFIQLKNQMSYKALNKLLGGKAWVHTSKDAKNSYAKAITYTQKDGKFWEWGTKPICGLAGSENARLHLADYEAAREEIKNGLEITNAKIWFQHHNVMTKVLADNQKKPATLNYPELKNEWIYGKAGIGKSRGAREKYPEAYCKNKDRWWPNYHHEKDVIIDDWSPFEREYTSHLKIWADRYAFQADVKFGGLLIRPERIIITSQYSIDECWEDIQTREAMHRRFTEIHMESEAEAIGQLSATAPHFFEQGMF